MRKSNRSPIKCGRPNFWGARLAQRLMYQQKYKDNYDHYACFRIGAGVSVESSTLLSYNLPQGFSINNVAVATDKDKIGTWEFGNRIARKL